eukprot:675844-Amphidinium_carterae.1
MEATWRKWLKMCVQQTSLVGKLHSQGTYRSSLRQKLLIPFDHCGRNVEKVKSMQEVWDKSTTLQSCLSRTEAARHRNAKGNAKYSIVH